MDQKMKTDTQTNNAHQSEGEARLIIKDRILSDLDAKIVELWNQGQSAGQIGDILKISRNSVIGKIWRLRQKGIETASHERPKNNIPRVRKRYDRKPKSLGMSFNLPKPRSLPVQNEPPVVNAKNITFWKLNSNSCRYVMNDGRPENFLFCGAPKERGPYCEAHALICYIPARLPARTQHNPTQPPRYYR